MGPCQAKVCGGGLTGRLSRDCRAQEASFVHGTRTSHCLAEQKAVRYLPCAERGAHKILDMVDRGRYYSQPSQAGAC